MIKVQICMGSSCFSRGNSKTLSSINEFLEQNGLQSEVSVCGSLCEGKCSTGPHIKVNGVMYDGITPETAIDILKRAIEEDKGK